MTFAVSLVVVVAALAFAAWPLFNGTGARLEASPATPDAISELEGQKLAAYSAIKEAEFDFQMDKLSDADFAAMREKYGARAIEAIAAIDRARGRASARQERIAFCPQCGKSVPDGAAFCGGCGCVLRAATAVA